MKTSSFLLLAFASLYLCCSCKKNSTNNTNGINIYFTGTYSSNVNSAAGNVGIYWKNGIATLLPPISGNGTVVDGIAFAGNDMCLVGYFGNNFGYWRNGTSYPLLMSNSYLSAITTVGNDVYTAGYIGGVVTDTTKFTTADFPVYFKNDSMTILSPHALSGVASAITAVGNDVYIAGYTVYSRLARCTYWKNNQEILLADTAKASFASGIAVVGSDVYVIGAIIDPSTLNRMATCWKNGTEVILEKTPGMVYTASAITINGNDVYIAGEMINPISGSGGTPLYWKNGKAVILDGDAGTIYNTTCIAVGDTDVYVGGYISTPISGTGNFHKVAACWKNGALTKLSTGGATGDGIVTSVALRE